MKTPSVRGADRVPGVWLSRPVRGVWRHHSPAVCSLFQSDAIRCRENKTDHLFIEIADTNAELSVATGKDAVLSTVKPLFDGNLAYSE